VILGHQCLDKAEQLQWGYDSDPMHFFKQQGHQTILSHAQDLLHDIRLERETAQEKTRPIIFVGHSLGGLVVKQVLIFELDKHHESSFDYLGSM
jgi:hypothetical protein